MRGDEPADRAPRTLRCLELETPSFSDEAARKRVLGKLKRDYPWTLEDGWKIEYWGLRQNGPRSFLDGRISARGPRLPSSRLPRPLLAPVGWAVHFWAALRPQAGVLAAAVPWRGVGAAAAGLLLGRRRPALIVRVQGSTASKSLRVRGSRLRHDVIRLLESWVLSRADLVLPMGAFTREVALRAGVAPQRIVVLPFPTSWGGDGGIAGEDAPDATRVVCAARLYPEKGIDVLLRAWAGVVKAVPGARLEIAGDGPAMDTLQHLARELGVVESVRFRGWLRAEEMPSFFSRALVCVLPSRWEEGLGMVLVEAGLARCALVGSDLGGITDMIESGRTGILVPPEDVQALERALLECLEQPHRAHAFGIAARERALDMLAARERQLPEVRRWMYDLGDRPRAVPAPR